MNENTLNESLNLIQENIQFLIKTTEKCDFKSAFVKMQVDKLIVIYELAYKELMEIKTQLLNKASNKFDVKHDKSYQDMINIAKLVKADIESTANLISNEILIKILNSK